jgi:DNA-binding NarL/FixJ family response regulator
MTGTVLKEIKLLIADDHRVLLDGLASLLKSEPGFQVMATVESGTQVIELMQKKEYDICLLDISMPGMDGIETAKWIKDHKPETKIIILTTHDEEEIIAEMIDIGVNGYLLKSSTRQELVNAINRVMEGKLHFSDKVNEAIIKGYTNRIEKIDPKEHVHLTEREKEIILLLAKEYTNEKIANELNISYRTVETHRKNIMQKTKARNLAGLIKFAYSQHMLD